MKKHHHLSHLHHATHAGAQELANRGMPHASNAILVVGATTGAIGHKVRGWEHDVSHMMHPVLGGHSKHHGGHSSGRKKHRTAAQKRATAKMLAAARRARGGSHKRRKGHSGGAHKKRRTAAQRRATAKLVAMMKRRRRGKR